MRDINSFSHRIDIGLIIINIWRHFSTKLATFHLPPQYNNTAYLFRSWSQVTNCKEDIIKNFDNGKASDIAVCVIKSLSPIISPFLCEYYNAFLTI